MLVNKIFCLTICAITFVLASSSDESLFTHHQSPVDLLKEWTVQFSKPIPTEMMYSPYFLDFEEYSKSLLKPEELLTHWNSTIEEVQASLDKTSSAFDVHFSQYVPFVNVDLRPEVHANTRYDKSSWWPELFPKWRSIDDPTPYQTHIPGQPFPIVDNDFVPIQVVRIELPLYKLAPGAVRPVTDRPLWSFEQGYRRGIKDKYTVFTTDLYAVRTAHSLSYFGRIGTRDAIVYWYEWKKGAKAEIPPKGIGENHDWYLYPKDSDEYGWERVELIDIKDRLSKAPYKNGLEDLQDLDLVDVPYKIEQSMKENGESQEHVEFSLWWLNLPAFKGKF